MRGLDQLSLLREGHGPLHRMRTRGGVVKAHHLHPVSLHLDIHRRGERRDGLVHGGLRIQRPDLGLRASEGGVAERVSKPVGVCGFALFGPNVVEGRDGKRVDRRGRKERVAALEDGDNAYPAFAIAGNRSGKDAHVARTVISRVLQEEMIREGGADDLAVIPVALADIPDRRIPRARQ